jgi:hypothetical protein
MLVAAGVITAQQLGQALRLQQQSGGRIGTNLVELGIIDETTLSRFLSQQLRIPAVSAASIDRASPAVLKRLPASDAARLRAVPIREDKGKLWVAFADPADPEGVAEVSRLVGCEVRPMVAPELLVKYALEKHYKIRRAGKLAPQEEEIQIHEGDLEPADMIDSAPLYNEIPSGEIGIDEQTGYLDETPMVARDLPASGPLSALTLHELCEQMAGAGTDEVVLEMVLRYLNQDIARVWALLLRDGQLFSWRGRGIEPQVMANFMAKPDELGLVKRAMASGEVLAGRIQPGGLGVMAATLGVREETLGAILPIRLARRPVGAIIAIDATLSAMRRKTELDQLAVKLDHALHINFLRRELLT